MKHSHTSPQTPLDPTNPGAGPRLCEPQKPRVPARTACLGRGRCGSQSRGPAALLLIAAAILAPLVATAQQDITNRLSLSARFGFNISARFKGLSTLPAPPNRRTTPGRGDPYNYDDGYVLPDKTGSSDGMTWYWGYDDSTRQVGNNSILLSKTTFQGPTPEVTAQDDPSYGVELLYQRLLGKWRKMRYGIELAGNYQNLSLSDSRTITANATRTTYPFAFTPGTTPPLASPGTPYQGSYEGPGFVISDTYDAPTASIVAGGAMIAGQRQFDADVWGFRLGPYMDFPIGQRLDVSLSGGLAGAVVDGSVSWHESLSFGGASGATVSGSGHGDDMLWGFYLGANAAWRFNDRWSAIAGIQYQDIGTSTKSYSGREVELNLKESFFVTVGLAWNF